MSLGLWNLQWLNHNSQRAYPLTERATKLDTTETIQLPDSFIVGIYFPVSAAVSVSPENFFIRSVLLAPTGFNIVIGYSDGSTTVDAAAANIARINYAPNRAYALGGIDSFAESVGQIVLGTLDEIDALPAGMYTFNQSAGEIEADAIRPMIRGVSSIRVINDQETSSPIYGNITLVAGRNMRIDTATNENGDTEITFNAVSGLNLNEDCACDIPNVAPCIRCINGVCSDDGTFTFTQDDCIEVSPINNGLSFKDTCAQPCCGCTELEAITTQINRFGDGVTTLQNFVTRLGSEVTQMSLVVLGSKLNDTGCAGG
ncbi:hypothetical protein EBZ39_02770 [bacterium]|nr:hypothetical protein [bacterium]